MDTVSAQATRDRLFREFDTVLTEAEQLLATASEAGGATAGEMRASVEQAIARASDRLAALRDRSMRQATDAAHTADEYVHENPWASIGVAAALAGAAGLVAGLLIARR